MVDQVQAQVEQVQTQEPIAVEPAEVETYDMEHNYTYPQMWAANLIWTAIAGSMAYKSIMGGIVDADFTATAAKNNQYYQYGQMIFAYSGAIFWTVGTLLQAISLAFVLVDINIMFWYHSAMAMMALEGIAELLVWYAYDASKVEANTNSTAADVAFVEQVEKEMTYDAAHAAWLAVTFMGLHDMWIAGQWDMLPVEKRKVFVDMEAAKMKEAYEKNMAKMMGDKDMDMDMDDKEMEDKEMEGDESQAQTQPIEPTLLLKTLMF